MTGNILSKWPFSIIILIPPGTVWTPVVIQSIFDGFYNQYYMYITYIDCLGTILAFIQII